jgi:hypothetical protein
MARPTEWRRFFNEYVEGATKSNQHFLQLPGLNEGETLGRIRLNWQALHTSPNTFDGAGFAIAMGINVEVAGTGTGSMPYPQDDPNAPWVWWEAPILQSQLGSDNTGLVQEQDVAPAYDTYRDVRAMRKADIGGSDVWFQTQTSNLSFGQCDHYLTVTGSMLIILEA